MRLSWNEVRARAASFAKEWRDAAYEKGETQSFYNDFFEVFDVRRRSVARYEEHVGKLDNRSGFIDLFWPGVLIVEQWHAIGIDVAIEIVPGPVQLGDFDRAGRGRVRWQAQCRTCTTGTSSSSWPSGAGNIHPSSSRSGFRRLGRRGDHRSHTEHLLSITF